MPNPFGFDIGTPAGMTSRKPRQVAPEPVPFGFPAPRSKMQQTADILKPYITGPFDAFQSLMNSPFALGFDPTEQDAANGLAAGGGAMMAGSIVPKPANALNMGIRAYHSSPYSFDEFKWSPENRSMGDGTQSHGDGLYFGESEAVAGRGGSYWRQFKDKLSREGKNTDPTTYEVDIDADQNTFLDWDNPLTREIPQQVKDAINKIANSDPAIKEKFYSAFQEKQPGSAYYDILSGHAKTGDLVQNQMFATKKLQEAGLPGIKFLDAGSRAAGAGTSNYVVFDPKLVKIVRKLGIAGASAMLGYNILDGMDKAQAAELKQIEGK